jgi:hypothetical protein
MNSKLENSFVKSFCELYESIVVLIGLSIVGIIGIVLSSIIVVILPIVLLQAVTFPFDHTIWFLGIAGMPTVLYFILKPTLKS